MNFIKKNVTLPIHSYKHTPLLKEMVFVILFQKALPINSTEEEIDLFFIEIGTHYKTNYTNKTSIYEGELN